MEKLLQNLLTADLHGSIVILAVLLLRAEFLYQENHALDAWFKKAYGDEEKPCYNN